MDTRVNKRITELRKRQSWKEVSAHPSTSTAIGTATQPTIKSATARETIRQNVGCFKLLVVHSATMTNILPRQQLTAINPSNTE